MCDGNYRGGKGARLKAAWDKKNPNTPFPIRPTNVKKEDFHDAYKVKSNTTNDKGETKSNNNIATVNYKKKMQQQNISSKQTTMARSLMSNQTLGG